MAYDAQGNYYKSADDLIQYMNGGDSGAEFRIPTAINTNSILDMEAIFPVSNAQSKSNNTINGIATSLTQNVNGVVTIGIYGLIIAVGLKLLFGRK